MKYYIDNLVMNAIKCAEKKGVCITIDIVEDKELWDYFTLRIGCGLIMSRCATTSVRNLLFYIHQIVYSQHKDLPWATNADFYDHTKL